MTIQNIIYHIDSYQTQFIQNHRSYVEDDCLIIESNKILGYSAKILKQWHHQLIIPQKQILFQLFCDKHNTRTKTIYLNTKATLFTDLPIPKNDYLKNLSQSKFHLKNFLLDIIDADNERNIPRTIVKVKIPLYGKNNINSTELDLIFKEMALAEAELAQDLKDLFGEIRQDKNIYHYRRSRNDLANLDYFYDYTTVMKVTDHPGFFTYNKQEYSLHYNGGDIILTSFEPLHYDLSLLPTKRQRREVFLPYEHYYYNEIHNSKHDYQEESYLGNLTFRDNDHEYSLFGILNGHNINEEGFCKATRSVKLYKYNHEDYLEFRDLKFLINNLHQKLKIEQAQLDNMRKVVLVKKENENLILNKKHPTYYSKEYKIILQPNKVEMIPYSILNNLKYKEKFTKIMISDKKKKDFKQMMQKWDNFFEEVDLGHSSFIIETSKDTLKHGSRLDSIAWQKQMSEDINSVQFKITATARNTDKTFTISEEELEKLSLAVNEAQKEFNKDLSEYFKIRVWSYENQFAQS